MCGREKKRAKGVLRNNSSAQHLLEINSSSQKKATRIHTLISYEWVLGFDFYCVAEEKFKDEGL